MSLILFANDVGSWGAFILMQLSNQNYEYFTNSSDSQHFLGRVSNPLSFCNKYVDYQLPHAFALAAFSMFGLIIPFSPASPKAKAGLRVPSLRPSVLPSVPKSCHRNSSETTNPIIMKLGM